MKHSRRHRYLLVMSLICSMVLFSCRKKEARYEGTYIGTERHTELDSGANVYSLDSTHHQEVDVTYSKKIYTFIKLVSDPDYNGTFTIGRKSFVDHEYTAFGEMYYDSQGNDVGSTANLKFSGDSMYINSWYYFNGDQQTLEFKGKRD